MPQLIVLLSLYSYLCFSSVDSYDFCHPSMKQNHYLSFDQLGRKIMISTHPRTRMQLLSVMFYNYGKTYNEVLDYSGNENVFALHQRMQSLLVKIQNLDKKDAKLYQKFRDQTKTLRDLKDETGISKVKREYECSCFEIAKEQAKLHTQRLNITANYENILRVIQKKSQECTQNLSKHEVLHLALR